MNRTAFRRIALGVVAVPLSLALVACGSKEEGNAAASGEAIAKITPPAGKNWTEMVEKTPEGGYRVGNPDAPIKFVEYGALSCSHCADFSKQSSAEMMNDFVASGRVSFELRLFMLNALDMPAALLVTCGPAETVPTLAKQFWGWQDTMFENLKKAGDARLQAISNQPPPAQFVALAGATGMDEFVKARGISADQAASCLADSNKATELANQTQRASKEDEITGTPSFLINGQKAETNSWPELKAKLQALGAR